MKFPLRPFAACLEAFRTLGPRPGKRATKKPKPLKEFKLTGYGLQAAWSFDDLKALGPGPKDSLYQFGPEAFDLAEFTDGSKIFDRASMLGPSIGTWNASDDDGNWAVSKGDWAIVRAELGRGDNDDGWGETTTDVTVALWTVSDGFAAAVLHLEDDEPRLTALMGIPFPTTWSHGKVWFGE